MLWFVAETLNEIYGIKCEIKQNKIASLCLMVIDKREKRTSLSIGGADRVLSAQI